MWGYMNMSSGNAPSCMQICCKAKWPNPYKWAITLVVIVYSNRALSLRFRGYIVTRPLRI